MWKLDTDQITVQLQQHDRINKNYLFIYNTELVNTIEWE